MEQLKAIATMVGLDPATLGIGTVLAILLRYARGMFHRFTSEATYVAALLFGAAGAAIQGAESGHWEGVTSKGLALVAFVLVGQKVLEIAAKNVPWLPQDNEWAPKEVNKP